MFGDPVLGNQLDQFGFGTDHVFHEPSIGQVKISEVAYDYADMIDFMQYGSFTLATVTFKAKACGSGEVKISSYVLGDAQANPLTADQITNGNTKVEDYSAQMSAGKDCSPKDVFDTSAKKLEDIYVAGTLPAVPAGTYTFYLTGDKNLWTNEDAICPAGCVASKLIDIDSTGHFCGLLWTPPEGDKNNYDIVLDVNGNGKFDSGTDFRFKS